MIWFIVNMIVLMGCTICYLDNEFFAWCKSMFLYEKVRFDVLFMTILTDNNRFFVVKCRYKEHLALTSHVLGTSSFAPLQITCMRFKVLPVRSCVISEVISGSLFCEITQTLRGVGPCIDKPGCGQNWKFYRHVLTHITLPLTRPLAKLHIPRRF
jgi:hypothetical protein